MGLKLEFYKSQLRRLFPKGKIWQPVPGSTLDKLIEGIAVELERIDLRASKLLDEADPRTTNEMLEDWEDFLGLPGDCGNITDTNEERRNALVTKLTLQGGMSKGNYAAIAQQLGYDVEIHDIFEFSPFVAGSRAGDRLTNGDWSYAWAVVIPEFTTRLFRAGSHSAGDRLVEFGDDLLECVIEEQKPAHTVVLFQYV